MSSSIPLSSAGKAIEAGKAKAAELGIAFTISVLDDGARLIALSRMDGAALASVESSQAKARTSVYFAAPPRLLAVAVPPGAPLFGIDAAFGDPVVFVGGAVPLTDAHGAVIGAIG